MLESQVEQVNKMNPVIISNMFKRMREVLGQFVSACTISVSLVDATSYEANLK